MADALASLPPNDRWCFVLFNHCLRHVSRRSLQREDCNHIASYLLGHLQLFLFEVTAPPPSSPVFSLQSPACLSGLSCCHRDNATFLIASPSGAFIWKPSPAQSSPRRLPSLPAQPIRSTCLNYDAMALLGDGELYTSGRALPCLGHNRLAPQTHPKPVAAFAGMQVQQVAFGAGHCAAVCDGGLFTFGCGEDGQLGHGDTKHHFAPKFVEDSAVGKGIRKVVCGQLHTVLMWSHRIMVCGNGVTAIPTSLSPLSGQAVYDVAAGGLCTVVASAAGIHVIGADFRSLHLVALLPSPLPFPGAIQLLGCPSSPDEVAIALARTSALLTILQPRLQSRLWGPPGIQWNEIQTHPTRHPIQALAASGTHIALLVDLAASHRPPPSLPRRAPMAETLAGGLLGLGLGVWLGTAVGEWWRLLLALCVAIPFLLWPSPASHGLGWGLQVGLALGLGLCIAFEDYFP